MQETLRPLLPQRALSVDGNWAAEENDQVLPNVSKIVFLILLAFLASGADSPKQPILGHRSAPLVKVDGLTFKDLNRNGKLDPYEDWRLPADSTALLGDFGISDEALMALVTGKESPEGRLPFELPSSSEAVQQQKSDLPHDSASPLFSFGFGLHY